MIMEANKHSQHDLEILRLLARGEKAIELAGGMTLKPFSRKPIPWLIRG